MCNNSKVESKERSDMTKDGVLCHRCDTFYENPDEAFYWEERVGNYRRPCKKCIAEYNKQPDQYRKRQAANKRYQASKKRH
jgi:hydrogenase maturation factor HypF (carbamoyltransferase family)